MGKSKKVEPESRQSSHYTFQTHGRYKSGEEVMTKMTQEKVLMQNDLQKLGPWKEPIDKTY